MSNVRSDELLKLAQWTYKNYERLLAEAKLKEQLREADRDLTPRFGEPGYRPKLYVVKETN